STRRVRPVSPHMALRAVWPRSKSVSSDAPETRIASSRTISEAAYSARPQAPARIQSRWFQAVRPSAAVAAATARSATTAHAGCGLAVRRGSRGGARGGRDHARGGIRVGRQEVLRRRQTTDDAEDIRREERSGGDPEARLA